MADDTDATHYATRGFRPPRGFSSLISRIHIKRMLEFGGFLWTRMNFSPLNFIFKLNLWRMTVKRDDHLGVAGM